MRGARTAIKLGVEVNVLSCVSRASEGRARETYEFLKGEGFAHLQYIPVVESVDRPGGAVDTSVRPEAYGDFLIELFETWRADPDPACIRLFDGLVELAGTGRSPFCILAPKCASYLVVEASGDLYPCDFFVLEELKVGNLLRTPIPAARALPAAKEFAAIKLTRPEKCRECKWWKVCRGGCLKERQRSGGFDRPGYLCEGMKRFLDHSWRHFEALAHRHFAASSGPSEKRGHLAGGDQQALAGRAPGRRGSSDPRSSQGVPISPRRPRAGAPCPCGSGRKYKRCCGRER